jgi:predicted ATPase
MARDEARAYAQELSHPFSTGYSCGWDALLQSLCLDVEATRASADDAVAISSEHGLGQWLPMGRVFQSWARAEQGAVQGEEPEETEAGIVEFEEAIAAFRATGIEFLQPYLLALLAGLNAKAGHTDRGLRLSTKALALVDKSGGHWCEAEMYRRKGELLLLRRDEAAAEVAYERALAIARSQQAKSLELRAATRLAALWHSQGRSGQAMHLLNDLCAWFTEGFNSRDMQAARALLDKQ